LGSTAIEVIEHVESPIGFFAQHRQPARAGRRRGNHYTQRRLSSARFNVASMLSGESMIGDNHVLVLENAS
jgi:hypothetical protein